MEQPRDCHGFNGREGALECKAAGMEPIEYLWLKNENGKNTRLSEKPGICIKKEEGLLFFESLDAEHWGHYKCQAQNRIHFATSETVKVSCEPYKVKGMKKIHLILHVLRVIPNSKKLASLFLLKQIEIIHTRMCNL